MAKVGAQRAAELTGKSKSTIQRAMNSGKLSYEIDANKRRIIDVSELERVFGLAPAGNDAKTHNAQVSAEDELKKASNMLEMERMKMRIAALETQLDTAESTVEDLKGQRDQWQKQAQQVLITSQYSQKQAEELKSELKEREERARLRHEKRLAERMQQMQGGQETNQNNRQRQSQHNQAQSVNSGQHDDNFSVKGLWHKIKNKTAA